MDAQADIRDIYGKTMLGRRDSRFSSTHRKRTRMTAQDNATDSGKNSHASNITDNENRASSDAQPFRDPAHWKTGEEPITASQKSYLSTLATEAGESEEADESLDSLTKAEASIRINELRDKTGRGQ